MTVHGQIKSTGLLYIKPISGLWRILMDSAVKTSLIREQKMESLAWCLAPNLPELGNSYQSHQTQARDFLSSKTESI